MPIPEIHLVVFDLGGVLMRLVTSWRDAFDRAQTPYPAKLDEPDVSQALWKLVDKEEVGHFGELGFFDQAEALLDIEAAVLVRVLDAYMRGPFPGAADLLHELADHSITTACLSNTNHNHWKDLTNPDHANGLPLHKLDHRVASQLIGHRKPHPEIYKHLEELSGFSGKNILFFDDRPENTQAAAKLGWVTHQVQDPHDTLIEIRTTLQHHGILS